MDPTSYGDRRAGQGLPFMAPLPPPDPALESLHAALDGRQMEQMLQKHLLGCDGGRLRIKLCRPRRVSYNPGRKCLVIYELALRDTETGSMLQTVAHARLYRDDRGEQLWSNEALSRLVERAEALHPQSPVSRAAYIPEMRTMIQLYPVDVKLPGLVYAASSTRMQLLLREVLPFSSGLYQCQPELVRYKPERRAVLRYRFSGTDAGVVYAKLRCDDRGAEISQVTHALVEAGVSTPVSLAYLPELRMMIHAEAPGRSLGARGDSSEIVGWMGPVAETLARLHRIQLPGLASYAPKKEARKAAQLVATLLSELTAEVAGLAASIDAYLDTLTAPAGTVHGAFTVAQLLVSDAGVMMLDLDDVGLGPPLSDVGHFLADLSVRRWASPEAAEDMRATFLDAYGVFDRYTRADVLLYEAASMLKRSVYPFKRLSPRWPEEIGRRVRLARQRLEEYERSRFVTKSG